MTDDGEPRQVQPRHERVHRARWRRTELVDDRRGRHAPPAVYAYDFGDDWQHVLVHEGFESADGDGSYPRCVAGEGRCPPEDCGGVHGYAEFLQIIADADHQEHESTLRWAGGSFDPEAFDPAAVKFDNPKKRWRKAFGHRR